MIGSKEAGGVDRVRAVAGDVKGGGNDGGSGIARRARRRGARRRHRKGGGWEVVLKWLMDLFCGWWL